jgi:hypothetical protein
LDYVCGIGDHRSVALSPQRRAALVRECDGFGEQAALAYRDMDLEVALAAADRAVGAVGELFRHDPDDRTVAEVFAERLRDRAEIRLVWAVVDPDRAGHLVAGGIEDASAALAHRKDLDSGPGTRYPRPLQAAEIHLLLGELYVAEHSPNLAVHHTVSSIEIYRHHHRPGESHSDLYLARALCRYADVLDVVGAQQAFTARLEGVRLYRVHAVPGGDLWDDRFSRSATMLFEGYRPGIWLSTPTLDGFCYSACRLVTGLGTPSVTAAGEGMAALQDAAEGFAAMLPAPSPTAALRLGDPEVLDRVNQLVNVLCQLMDWSRAISAPLLVRAYDQAWAALAADSVGGGHYERIRAIRAPLTDVLRRLAGRGRRT